MIEDVMILVAGASIVPAIVSAISAFLKKRSTGSDPGSKITITAPDGTSVQIHNASELSEASLTIVREAIESGSEEEVLRKLGEERPPNRSEG